MEQLACRFDKPRSTVLLISKGTGKMNLTNQQGVVQPLFTVANDLHVGLDTVLSWKVL